MSLAGGDLDRSQASRPSGDSRQPKDEPLGATESHKPDQRYKGYVADDYAASNPWHGQPRSSPVFGLAESLPHTVRSGQGLRHAKREEQHHKCEDDIEKGKTEMRKSAPSTPRGRGGYVLTYKSIPLLLSRYLLRASGIHLWIRKILHIKKA